MDHLLPALEFIRKKTDLTDEEVDNFQVEFDLFFQDWVKLWGQKTTSNLIHMCQSGYISEFLCHWRNLHNYFQQS